MERWKELLQTDLESVARGYAELGKDATQVEACIKAIPGTSKDNLAVLLTQCNLGYFAGKLGIGDYDRMADIENQEKAAAE
jgi:hypothetical protein